MKNRLDNLKAALDTVVNQVTKTANKAAQDKRAP